LRPGRLMRKLTEKGGHGGTCQTKKGGRVKFDGTWVSNWRDHGLRGNRVPKMEERAGESHKEICEKK